MNKIKNLIGKTKFHVFLRKPADSQPIEIQLDGNTYYRIELGKKFKIGNFYEMVQFLSKYDAKLAFKKGKRFKPYQFFFTRKEALNLLKEAYCVVSVESAVTLSYTDDFTNIVSSDGKMFGEGSLPCGQYCIALNEQRLSSTYNEVMAQKEAERTRAMEDEAEKAKRQREIEQKERRRVKEEAIKAAKQEQVERNNEKKNSTEILKPEIPVENDDSLLDSLLKIAGGIGIFLTGIGLGMFLDKKLN